MQTVRKNSPKALGLWRRRKVPPSDPDFFSLLTANSDLLIKILKRRCEWMALLPKTGLY